MRIAMIGAGGVGGYFGALLARAGHEVTLFARGSHLDAIRATGLEIRGPDSSFHVDVHATDDVRELVGAELVIVAVKSYSLVEVSSVIAALARDGADVLPLLNGVATSELLEAGGVPRDRILGSLAFVNAFKAAPGVIQHAGWLERVVLGEFDGSASRRIENIAEVLRSAGIEAVISMDVVCALWQKFNFICALAAACGMARCTVGEIRCTALGRLLLERAVAEIAAVGRATGVALPADIEVATMARIDAMHESQKPSFLLDVERGGPTELDVLSGAVSRLGRKLGIPTPIHDTAAAVLMNVH